MLSVHRFLRKVGVELDDLTAIVAINDIPSVAVRVTFKTTAIFTSFVENHGGVKGYYLEGRKGFQISVREANKRETFIRIGDYPVHLDLEPLTAQLKQYGKVNGVVRERFRAEQGSDYFPVLNGFVKVRMEREKDIPSYLTVGGKRVFVNYSGQPKTCRGCGEMGHFANECEKSRRPTHADRTTGRKGPAAKQPEEKAPAQGESSEDLDSNGELNEQVQQQPNVEERQEEPAVVEDTTTVRLPTKPEARTEVEEENPLVAIEKPPVVVTEETPLVEEEQPTELSQYVNELTSPTFGQLEVRDDDMESVISEGGDNATEGKGELRRSRRTAAVASGGHKRSTPSSPTPFEANQTSNKSKKKKEKERGGGKPQC